MNPKLSPVQPPRASEIELRVITSLIYIGDSNNLRIKESMLKLDLDCFIKPDHKILFKLILQLFEKGHPFDFVEFSTIVPDEQYPLVTEMIKEQYISTNSLERDIETLIAYRTWRRQLHILVNTINASLDKSIAQEAVTCIREELQALSNVDATQAGSLLRSYHDEIDDALNQEDDSTIDFPVDIPNLPNVPNNSLIIVAGRSGHGKTFFSMYLMDAIIDAHPLKQTLYFNLEMHPHVMIERHAILLGSKGVNRRERIGSIAHVLLRKNVSLISVPMITIEQIEAESRLAALKQPICCIVVDYLNLVGSKAKYERKELQQSDLAKRLAALSLELGCVVIGLIQVNRESRNRQPGDRCPLTSDAADSMGSVNSASWWLGIDQPQNDDDSPMFRDLFMVACRKNRGDSGMFNLNLEFRNGQFSPWMRGLPEIKATKTGF